MDRKHAAELSKQKLKAALLECDRVEKELNETGDKIIDTTASGLEGESEVLKLQHKLEERLRSITARTSTIKHDLKKVTDEKTAEAELVLQAHMYHDVDDYKAHLALLGGSVKDKDLDKKAERLRAYMLGMNYKLNEVQLAVTLAIQQTIMRH